VVNIVLSFATYSPATYGTTTGPTLPNMFLLQNLLTLFRPPTRGHVRRTFTQDKVAIYVAKFELILLVFPGRNSSGMFVRVLPEPKARQTYSLQASPSAAFIPGELLLYPASAMLPQAFAANLLAQDCYAHPSVEGTAYNSLKRGN